LEIKNPNFQNHETENNFDKKILDDDGWDMCSF
jgi:hypothetical protein